MRNFTIAKEIAYKFTQVATISKKKTTKTCKLQFDKKLKPYLYLSRGNGRLIANSQKMILLMCWNRGIKHL